MPALSLSERIRVSPERSAPPLNRAERRAAEREERLALRPRLVSVQQACRYANVSRSYFYATLLSRVRTIKMGKRLLIEFDSLDELLDELANAG
jgi:excisionase family DNA binding protein